MKKEKSAFLLFVKLSPLLIPFILLFSAGIGLAILQSFNLFTPVPAAGNGIDNYIRLLKDPWFLKSFFHSFSVAFFSALLSVICGTFIAYMIWQLPYRYKIYAEICKIPLILPQISIAFIVFVLAGKTGFISSILYNLGIIDDYREFPSILFGGNGLGIIIAYVYKQTPFVILMLGAIFRKINIEMIQQARMLGAGGARIFFKVILPCLLPAVNTVFIILFLYSFGAFDIPYMLSESYPQMLSIGIFNLYFQRDILNRPSAMAMLVLMLVFTCLFVFIYSRLGNRLSSKERSL